MVNANLGMGYDFMQRLNRIEQTLRDLSTQPILLHASTGQDGGKGVSTDKNGIHLFNPSGMETITLSTTDGTLTAANAFGSTIAGPAVLAGGSPGISFTQTGTPFGVPCGVGIDTFGNIYVNGPSTGTTPGYLEITQSGSFVLASDSNPGATAGAQIFTDVGANGSVYVEGGSGNGGVRIWTNGTGTVQVRGNTTVTGTFSATGTKAFIMPHPLDPAHKTLMHASTESPVNGVEYWGDVVVGADGTCVVTLPSYFESLTKPTGRNVQLTPVGGPCASVPWASEIVSGKFTINAPAGIRIAWLVKAERQRLENGVDVLHFDAETNVPLTGV